MPTKTNRFEDRGAAGTATTGPPVRNRGGFNAKPPQKGRGFVAPPPTSRSRQDTVQRPVGNQGGAPRPPTRRTFGGGKGIAAKTAMWKTDVGGVGPDRLGNVNAGRPGLRPKDREGGYEMTGRPSPAGAQAARISAPTSPANVRDAGLQEEKGWQQQSGGQAQNQPGQEPSNPFHPGFEANAANKAAQEGRTELPQPPSTPQVPGAMRGSAGADTQAIPPDQQDAGASQDTAMPGMEKTPERAQELQMTAPDGSKVQVKDKGPDREIDQQKQATNLEQNLDRMAQAQDGSRFQMGESALGWNMTNSERTASGTEFQGEMGPGMPCNDSGALGVPGGHNTPEDVQFNRQRFDDAARQHDGDHFKAAMSTGSFPSGQPMAQGQKGHMQQIIESKAGDGIQLEGMSEPMRRRYKQDAVKQLEDFGAYPGMDDPSSPAPPIRPLSFSFNPFTGKWSNPEGAESMMDRMGGEK